MGFNIDKFRNAKTKPRTDELEIEVLKSFFEEGEKPIFKMRNLTGHELAECREAVTANKQLRALVESLMSENALDKAKAICESMGLGSDKTPGDLVNRIGMLKHGLIEPKFTNEDSVRLASLFPTQFYQLTNRIVELTGLGAELGE